ncbi:hypothetical protein KHS38_09130 [Mucilaginibacter sp. Bleaf8]|uniref:type IX secretion system protein PorG n=1 Tax=Mucilaginibacter sp. Bleaf8 TaxID=2834430 RepID=UPI001BD1A127|nr:DUF6089 family protein [Mucilaginibacter sp. Bleaf8]MBS7564567.1 hypothetical protein [Mucilaginibacter sp. Bleaf8]
MWRIIRVLIVSLLGITAAQAQTWEIGLNAGANGYMGDLNQRNLAQVSGFAIGGYLKRNFNGYLSAKVQYNFGQIGAADSTSKYQEFRERNLSFTSRLHELSLIGEFNFMEFQPASSRNYYTPFIYAGIAAVNFNPQTMYQGETYDLRPLMTEGQAQPYSKTALAIPYGVGFKYNVSGKLNLIADIGYRTAFTDYLDDVSGYYAPKSNFTNSVSRGLSDRTGERNGIFTGQPGTQRGDLRKRDTYMFFGFTISYTFVSDKCYY